jgi:hypothetical protein
MANAGANLLDTANVYGGDYGTDTFGWSGAGQRRPCHSARPFAAIHTGFLIPGAEQSGTGRGG